MKACLSASVLVVCAVAAASPVVSNVSVSQDPGTRRVSVSYSLTGDPAIVTVEFLTNGVAVAEERFTSVAGDVNRIVSASDSQVRSIYWQPERDLPECGSGAFTARLRAWPTNSPPPYMDIELGKAAGLVKRFYASSNAVPGGVLHERYKTTHLLMRRVPAGGLTWCMCNGSDANEHLVKLTQDYYIGVYEFTQAQILTIGFANDSQFKAPDYPDWRTMPVDGITYLKIRCGNESTNNICWPRTLGAVGTKSVLRALRDYTGIPTFDLPTEAQWEYAYRAGASTPLYNGSYNRQNADLIAWHYDVSQYPSGVRAPHPVGLLAPNAWGIYDMAGNISEWCRDCYEPFEAQADDEVKENPPGAQQAGGMRVIKQGHYGNGYSESRAFSRYGYYPSYAQTSTAGRIGFRVVCDAVIPVE